MNLKTYHAYTMSEALAVLKQDLGDDAIILHTRTFKRRGLLGFGSRTIIEVTASANDQDAHEAGLVDADASGTPAVVDVPVPARSDAVQAYQRTSAIPVAEQDADPPSTPADEHVRRRESLAATCREELKQRALDEPVDLSGDDPVPEVIQQGRLRPVDSTSSSTLTAQPREPVDDHVSEQPPPRPRRFVIEQADHDGESAEDSLATTPVDATAPSHRLVEDEPVQGDGVSSSMATMEQELQAIKQMVGQVLSRNQDLPAASVNTEEPAFDDSLPDPLAEFYTRLVSQELAEPIARELVQDLLDTCPQEILADQQRIRLEMSRRIGSLIPETEPAPTEWRREGRPSTIALVGPTGVGKTTTLAKLAATFKIKQGARVGLITADTYRIAAVDQLQTYANIIGLDLKVVQTPQQMRQACGQLQDMDAILIDTAGRSQNDTDRINELNAMLEAASPHEVHLVLSATASEKVLLKEAEAFGAVSIDKVVLTKLDEAVSFGVLINVITRIKKQVSYVTTGQEVPHHIEVARPQRLADLVINGEVHA